MKLIDRLPVIGLAVAGHFLCAKKVANGNKATLIAILVDAQTLSVPGQSSSVLLPPAGGWNPRS